MVTFGKSQAFQPRSAIFIYEASILSLPALKFNSVEFYTQGLRPFTLPAVANLKYERLSVHGFSELCES